MRYMHHEFRTVTVQVMTHLKPIEPQSHSLESAIAATQTAIALTRAGVSHPSDTLKIADRSVCSTKLYKP